MNWNMFGPASLQMMSDRKKRRARLIGMAIARFSFGMIDMITVMYPRVLLMVMIMMRMKIKPNQSQP